MSTQKTDVDVKPQETAAKKIGPTSCEINEVLDRIFEQYPKEEASLIMVLQEIQDHFNWLPEEAIDRVGTELDVPKARVMGVITFYKSFSTKPRGKKLIKVCTGTACHVRGSHMIINELERVLKIKAGSGISEDGMFSLDAVNCIGACAMAPAVLVDDRYYAKVSPGSISKMLEKERKL